MTEIKRKWWMLAMRGGVLGLLALFIFSFDDIALVFLYWGILMLVLGGATLYYAIQQRKQEQAWIFPLLLSVMDIVLGLVVLLYTEEVLRIFRLIVGAWAIGIGFVLIYMALRSESQKWLLQINGMVSIALGVIIIFNPFSDGARLDSILLGTYSLFLGAYLVLLAFRIRPNEKKAIVLEIEEPFDSDEENVEN
jgi:uncharacterized membrane protein HdeD (DUF308 family)